MDPSRLEIEFLRAALSLGILAWWGTWLAWPGVDLGTPPPSLPRQRVRAEGRELEDEDGDVVGAVLVLDGVVDDGPGGLVEVAGL